LTFDGLGSGAHLVFVRLRLIVGEQPWMGLVMSDVGLLDPRRTMLADEFDVGELGGSDASWKMVRAINQMRVIRAGGSPTACP